MNLTLCKTHLKLWLVMLTKCLTASKLRYLSLGVCWWWVLWKHRFIYFLISSPINIIIFATDSQISHDTAEWCHGLAAIRCYWITTKYVYSENLKAYETCLFLNPVYLCALTENELVGRCAYCWLSVLENRQLSAFLYISASASCWRFVLISALLNIADF